MLYFSRLVASSKVRSLPLEWQDVVDQQQENNDDFFKDNLLPASCPSQASLQPNQTTLENHDFTQQRPLEQFHDDHDRNGGFGQPQGVDHYLESVGGGGLSENLPPYPNCEATQDSHLGRTLDYQPEDHATCDANPQSSVQVLVTFPGGQLMVLESPFQQGPAHPLLDLSPRFDVKYFKRKPEKVIC